MSMNKLNSNTMTSAAAFTGGAVAGSMVSNVLVDKIPLQNARIKMGTLAVLGLFGAAMINSKDNAGKMLQGAAVGMAATQLKKLVATIINPQEGILKTALGAPDTPIILYPSDMDYYNYQLDNPFKEEPKFLSGANEKFAII